MEPEFLEIVDSFFLRLRDNSLNDCKEIIEEILPKLAESKDLYSIKVLIQILEKLILQSADDESHYYFTPVMQVLTRRLNEPSQSKPDLKKNSEEDLLLIINLACRLACKQGSEDNILKLARFYHDNLKFVIDNYTSESCDKTKLSFRLKLLCCFICPTEMVLDNFKKLFKSIDELKLKSNLDEYKVFTTLVIHGSPEILKTMIFVVRHYIKSFNDFQLSKTMWTEISNLLSCKNTSVPYARILLVLCYIFDLSFGKVNESSNESVPSKSFIKLVHQDQNYWQLIQFGLTSNDPTMKKQAMYLLKKSIDLLTMIDENIVCLTAKLTDRENSADNLMMWWDSTLKDEISITYKELIIIMEFFDVQQVHLIKPVFKMIEDVVFKISSKLKNGNKTIDLSWIILIHEQSLNHESMQVVKWGLESLIHLEDEFYSDSGTLKTIVTILVETLNNANIYYNGGLIICENLAQFFIRMSKLKTGEHFFCSFIAAVCGLTWSPETLFFVIHALSLVPRVRFWQEHEINNIKTFVMKAFQTHNKTIRAGTQCQLLHSIMTLINEKNVELDNLILCLSSFSSSGALCQGSKIWNELILWLRESYTVDEAKICLEKYSSANLDSEIYGEFMTLMMLMFFEAYSFTEKAPNNTLVPDKLRNILKSFDNIDRRPYCDKSVLNNYLYLVCHILEANLHCENMKLPLLSTLIIPHLSDIIIYIQIQVTSVTKLQDHCDVTLYIRVLENIMACNSKDSKFKDAKMQDILNGLCEKIKADVIEYDKSNEAVPPIRIYCWMHILKILFKWSLFNSDRMWYNFIYSHVSKSVNDSLARDVATFEKKIDLQALWGRINSEFLETKWQILEHLIRKMPENSLPQEYLLKCCREALGMGGYGVLFPVTSLLKDILPKFEEIDCVEMVDFVWKIITERRKTNSFKQFTNFFVDMLFQRDLIQKEVHVQGIHLMYTNLIFADCNLGVLNGFMKHIQKLEVEDNVHPLFCHILAKGLLFGPVQRKDERLTAQVCSHVEALDIGKLSKYHTSSEIRGRAVAMVLSLSSANQKHRTFAWDLVEKLFEIEEDLNKKKLRYFGDSQVHRVKHRLVQALFLLEPILSDCEDAVDRLAQWLYHGLLSENPQPSVMYLQEWLLVRILLRHSRLLNDFWSHLNDSVNIKTKGVCSLITVLYHLCKSVPSDLTSSWLDRAILAILPFCMDQHFEVRLYAQVVTEKIYHLAEERDLSEILQKYSSINDGVMKSIQRGSQGNAGRNCKKLQEDFYFTIFDPMKHCSLETIYKDLPRLCNVGSDEWISTEVFRYCGVRDEESTSIPLKCSKHTLENVECAKWLVDGGNVPDPFLDDSSLVNYQKKIIPAQLALPGFGDEMRRNELARENLKTGGLIVVATLIDRIPNLGGLARTCEIFGASEYVVGSLKFVEDKQFASLSVTAEKWVNVKEVKRQDLSNYLFDMKGKGYVVVGAEQALNSRPLNTVDLPKKSLILLGNEKEGIPPDLLPLLDICVEVPQLGIIRSLNVHVTGALFIWEYAKQNYFSP